MQASSSNRLVELDALRGVAVMMVLFFHYTTRFSELFPQAAPAAVNFAQGRYGVELFFVISGFVITMTLHRSKCVSDFLVARFSRLYPTYWAAILLTSAVLWLAAGPLRVPSGSQVAINLTMVHTMLRVPSVDGVYWTLEVELLFYAMALALFTLGLVQRLHKPLFAWLVLAALFASPLWPAYIANQPFAGALARMLVLEYAPLFAIGMVFHRIYTREGMPAWNAGLIAFALGILLLTKPFSMAILVLAACPVFWRLTRGGIGFLRARPLTFLGTISYSLYLVHQNIGLTVMAKLGEHGASANLGLVVATIASIALATALTFLVERPSMNAMRNWYNASDWRARRHAAAAARTVGAARAPNV